jgi:hypothetical protein
MFHSLIIPLLTSTNTVNSLKTSTTLAQTGLPIQPTEFCYVVTCTHKKVTTVKKL